MALVSVANMVVLDNPAPFGNPLQFEITFECLQPLEDDLEWKVVYVSSAKDSTLDQTLDEILVGPIPVGINKFILQADAPDPNTIPSCDILGVTVLLVTCSYREKEFVRVGYYVNNEYEDEFEDEEVGPPLPLDMSKVSRTILADKPRVTRFPINWGDLSKEEETQQDQQQQQIERLAGMEGEHTPMVMMEEEEEEEEYTGNPNDLFAAGGGVGAPQDVQDSMITNE